MELTARRVAPTDTSLDRASSGTGPDHERPYERLARKISALILRGELRAGARMPSERELAERYRVSRTAIREAIIALEIRGVVEVRPASGIYTRPVRPSSIIAKGSAGPFELLRGRLIIEPPICASAASAAKDADLDAIYATIVAMKDTLNDKRANEVADRAFHVAIASATGNGMLTEIVGAVWDRRHGPMWDKIEEHFHTPALREAAVRDHQRIFNALAAHDPAEASAQMQSHIERVIAEFGKAW